MNQRQLKDSNCLETMFDITCNIHNDCNNYHTTIYKNKFGNVQNLNSYLECKRNFTDDAGYMIDCSGSLPDNLVESYSFIACKMEAKRPDNRVVKKEQRYTLPNCGVESRCHTREPGYAVFNCSEKASDYLNLQKAECSFPKQSNCLKPGRKVFDMYKDRFDNLTCSTDNTVPVCRLSWCSDYRFIRKNEIPGVVICSPSFNERYVSPTTTSTTVRTSPTASSNQK
ncbi:uncharacterized protein LOC132752087 [Ruditapes philippinarum]|uniref:uncharacterized protein LOC132752087 n=1 Tax=Ruditapes philippinarum TaxID=129788 RepID=UPI00295A985A|nr:uncharacterized protein LOC132752087 [Ruditapes philippinarum]